MVSVPKDGNCQPNSLLASLPASSFWHQRFTTHADVRQAVAEFVNNLQTMAARHRAKEADRKTGVAAAVRQRKQKAASTELLQPALDPGVAQEAQSEEKVTRRDAASAEEESFVRQHSNGYQVRTKAHS